MGMFAWLDNVRNKIDKLGSGYFQRKMNKELRVFRKAACMMATIFPWYEELNYHVNEFLVGQLGKDDLSEILKNYTFRFGSQYKLIVRGLREAKTTGWEESEIADREIQSLDEQKHMTRFRLAKEFVYAIEPYFDGLNKLVVSMETALKEGEQRELVRLAEEYLLELRHYQDFCQKYVTNGICEDVPL
jgi:hypothetical protein